MKWEDGWPVLGIDGKVPDILNIPITTNGLGNIVESDEFNRKPGEPALQLAFQWNHNPDDRYWSITERPGFLRLTTGNVVSELPEARNTLTQRTFGPDCFGAVAIDVSNMKDGDYAGLAMFQKKYGFIGVKMSEGVKSIVMVSAESNSPIETQTVPLNQNTVFLKIECDFNNRADKAYFFYSRDNKNWTAIGKPLQMVYTLPHFMGYRFTLFNYATKTAGGFVDFDYFQIGTKSG